ncbi:ABC-2 type transport system ATP-binding protein [Enterococcus sp. AZ194]|uniref:ATP-binding cassette domain-containing protein n=1 Tax=Enterococcus sp. AZ194 TaxID=2774629 RepID=UPI003F25204F
MEIIELRHVSKRIGKKRVLEEVTFSIKEGSVTGFSGPNGSGKSVIFSTILGFVKPTKGEVYVHGKQIRKDQLFASDIAFSMDNIGILEDFSSIKNLQLLMLLNERTVDNKKIINLLEYVGLDPTDTSKFKDYSLGMKKRLSLASCLLSESSILILDEPSNALDEEGKGFLKKLILEQKSLGKTILISNHDNEFLKEVSDAILEVTEGRVRTLEQKEVTLEEGLFETDLFSSKY